MRPRRIFLSGVTGSGKTTLARQIAARTGLPFINVDDLTWLPGWIEVSHDEQRRRFTEICAQEEWILDTAYGRWKDIPEKRVDLIVCLDYPRWISLGRLLKRSIYRASSKEPICNGNTESFRKLLSRDSIILWHFRSFSRKHRRAMEWAADPAKNVVILRTQAEATSWLNSLNPVGEHSDTGP